MPAWSTLMRLVLSLSLLLNGPGYATASAHEQMLGMGTAHASHHAAGHPVVHAGASCERLHMAHHAGMLSAALDTPTAGMHHPKSGHAAPDCCGSGLCDCACVQQAQASPAVLAFVQAMPHDGPAMHPTESGHVAPRLPHLIRPPIG